MKLRRGLAVLLLALLQSRKVLPPEQFTAQKEAARSEQALLLAVAIKAKAKLNNAKNVGREAEIFVVLTILCSPLQIIIASISKSLTFLVLVLQPFR